MIANPKALHRLSLPLCAYCGLPFYRNVNTQLRTLATATHTGFCGDVFFIDRPYAIDTNFELSLYSAISTKNRNTDCSDTFSVHGHLIILNLAGIR